MLDGGIGPEEEKTPPGRRSISRSIWPGSEGTDGLLVRIERPINKDTELHPLVRWQFQGGLKEDQRRAFLFTNVVDGEGRRYDMPVAIGALAASAEIYAVGMGRPVSEIGDAWMHAIANPIAPTVSDISVLPRGPVIEGRKPRCCSTAA